MLRNFVRPIICCVLSTPIVFCLLYFLIRWLKKTLKISVKCWCCGATSRVVYTLKNSWDCPKCEQYNGFTEDGDFNKDIPQMHDERLNRCVETFGGGKSSSPKPDVVRLTSPNGLCYQCNQNQLLKIRQLANFVPTCEEKFDEEIDVYRSRLEQIYSLCGRCRTFVNNELAYQNQKFGLADLLMTTTNNLRRRFNAKSTTTNASKRTTLITTKSTSTKKRRGLTSFVFKLSTIVAVSLLWLADLHNVQCDSRTELIKLNAVLPFSFVNFLPQFYVHATSICICALFVEFFSTIFYYFKTPSFMDYLAVLSFFVVTTTHWLEIDRWKMLTGLGRDDLFVLQFCSSTCTTLIVFCASVLPRRSRKIFARSSSANRSDYSPSESLMSSCNRSTSPSSLNNSLIACSDVKRFCTTTTSENKFPWRQELPDLFSSPTTVVNRTTRESSPSRVLGAKLSSLSLYSSSKSPIKLSNSFSNVPFASPLIKQQQRQQQISPRSSILAPPKFTVLSSPTSTAAFWTPKSSTNDKMFPSWSRTKSSTNAVAEFTSSLAPFNKTFVQPDDDTVSLLSGYSASNNTTTPSRKLNGVGVVGKSSTSSASENKSTLDFWKFTFGLVLAFSLLTNVTVLYHIYVKK